MTTTAVQDVKTASERDGLVYIRITLLCAIVLAFDGFDISAMGFIIPPLTKVWGISPAQFTPALVAGSLGMLFGALTAGIAGDYFGRRPVLITCVTLFGILSLLSSLSMDVSQLASLRFVTGLGLGGAVPTAVALASDYSPPGRQGRLVALMSAGLPAGIIVGGALSAALLSRFGWTSIFIAGGIGPLILSPILLFWLPESQGFQGQARSDGRSRAARASINPVSILLGPQLRWTTLLLWIVFITNFLASYLILLWLPSMLNASGATAAQAIVGTTLFPLAGITGAFILGWPIDKFGAERTLVAGLLVGALACAVVGFANLPYGLALLGLVFCVGLGLSGSQMGMNALSGSAYPTSIRATGSGWALGIGRAGTILGPLLGGLLLAAGFKTTAMFLFSSGAVLIAALAMGVLWIIRRPTSSHLAAGTSPHGAQDPGK
jgi:AAHS family 4-hydroxybenzoate transporter-like MFS transporter